jgi:hypothetical protein
MNRNQIIENITSGPTPKYVLAGAGILVVLLALKLAKGVVKIVLGLVALTLLAGAVWWHFQHQ